MTKVFGMSPLNNCEACYLQRSRYESWEKWNNVSEIHGVFSEVYEFSNAFVMLLVMLVAREPAKLNQLAAGFSGRVGCNYVKWTMATTTIERPIPFYIAPVLIKHFLNCHIWTFDGNDIEQYFSKLCNFFVSLLTFYVTVYSTFICIIFYLNYFYLLFHLFIPYITCRFTLWSIRVIIWCPFSPM